MRRSLRSVVLRLPRLVWKLPRWLFVAIAIYDVVQDKLHWLFRTTQLPASVVNTDQPSVVYRTYNYARTSTSDLAFNIRSLRGHLDSIDLGTTTPSQMCWHVDSLCQRNGSHVALHQMSSPLCLQFTACTTSPSPNGGMTRWSCVAAPMSWAVETSQSQDNHDDIHVVIQDSWTAQSQLFSVVFTQDQVTTWLSSSTMSMFAAFVSSDARASASSVATSTFSLVDATQSATAMCTLKVLQLLTWCLCLLAAPSTSTGLTTMLHLTLESPLAVLLQYTTPKHATSPTSYV
ncbi:Aste57867_6999 [Aphanomyces stellatus]|uniref:Aste57867_5695 protein n=1 Tax=Aphanomyces stellatus TaxID=120398 RepID=A0A485KEX6_9STRA|nr:hypothetical protein As57867_006976 [Aphanomyces stellatus]KAF0709947.1 hypothetical protein As57867_005682 [Aphanomyces stellatus]VFT82735.1 Aste57867_5695 [Aphanomyces stellatus]VFT83950.1 Aste57867_6999 [Aphanomyces stellatus]